MCNNISAIFSIVLLDEYSYVQYSSVLPYLTRTIKGPMVGGKCLGGCSRVSVWNS